MNPIEMTTNEVIANASLGSMDKDIQAARFELARRVQVAEARVKSWEGMVAGIQQAEIDAAAERDSAIKVLKGFVAAFEAGWPGHVIGSPCIPQMEGHICYSCKMLTFYDQARRVIEHRQSQRALKLANDYGEPR